MGFLKSKSNLLKIQEVVQQFNRDEIKLDGTTENVRLGMLVLAKKAAFQDLANMFARVPEIGLARSIEKAVLPVVKTYGTYLYDKSKSGDNQEIVAMLKENQINLKDRSHLKYVLAIANKFYEIEYGTSSKECEMISAGDTGEDCFMDSRYSGHRENDYNVERIRNHEMSMLEDEGFPSSSTSKMSNKQFVEFLSTNDRSLEFIVNFIYDRLPPSKQSDDKNKAVMDYLLEE